MNRRDFLKVTGGVCLACIGAASLMQSCKPAFYIPNSYLNSRIVLNKTDFADHKYVLVRSEKLQKPIYLYKHANDFFTAVYMDCTHKGCELNPAGDQLVCPCHGSEFSNTGKVLNPPAETDLKTFKVEIDQDHLYILL